MKKFFIEMLSECTRLGHSYISSKRVVGVLMMVIVMSCTIYLVWKEGGSDVVENLLQTAMIISASLLGISSVTGIWKGNSMKIGEQHEQKQDQISEDKSFECPYIKKAP